jgi:hypothetical protein
MKNIVLIPCWRRAEFLTVCGELLLKADGADRNVYVFLLDRGSSTEVQYVANSFPGEKIVKISPHHRFNGNSYNVLEGYKLGLDLVKMYNSELIYLVEEDIFVGRDFFKFHEGVQSSHQTFCVSAVRNQNDGRTPLGGIDPPDPAAVYRFDKFQSLGLSWRPENLRHVTAHAKTEYYSNMRRYLTRTFPKSAYGDMWSEQDGLINRVMERGQFTAAYPSVPRAYHAGFVGYNRKGESLTGCLEYRVEYLKKMTADDMNAKAAEYKDISPVDLDAMYEINEYRMVS